MPEGGLIEVSAANVTLTGAEGLGLPAGNHVRISIRDHGHGIAPEISQRIFDPYFTTKEMGSKKGQGLGLAICYSIIRTRHGAITVESEPQKGTTFHIHLPASARIAAANDLNFKELVN